MTRRSLFSLRRQVLFPTPRYRWPHPLARPAVKWLDRSLYLQPELNVVLDLRGVLAGRGRGES